MGRIASVEIASIARIFASDDASYITGQTIFANGGRLCIKLYGTVGETWRVFCRGAERGGLDHFANLAVHMS